jgi:hypothetical protein
MVCKKSNFSKLLDKALSGDADARNLIKFCLTNQDDLSRRQKARSK